MEHNIYINRNKSDEFINKMKYIRICRPSEIKMLWTIGVNDEMRFLFKFGKLIACPVRIFNSLLALALNWEHNVWPQCLSGAKCVDGQYTIAMDRWISGCRKMSHCALHCTFVLHVWIHPNYWLRRECITCCGVCCFCVCLDDRC